MKGKWRAVSLAVLLAILIAIAVGTPPAQTDSNSASDSAADSASPTIVSIAEDATDYSQKESWYKIPDITKDVDTFYIYSTGYHNTEEDDPVYAALDDPEMRKGAKNNYTVKASVFEDSTNLFMPYYRQAGMQAETDAWRETGDIDSVLSTMPYNDITAALDYYFENYNEGRPFIIAGHSQGSAVARLVLKNYFKEHPKYYERMVAAYIIGFSITKDDLEANPHLKFATGESDAGVIVSWNVEGPENVETNATNIVVMPNEVSINPLNWKLDDTYAPASENLGSLVKNSETNTYEIANVGADAQLSLERGVVVTNADYNPKSGKVFGPQSFHNGDYALYYNNIKDNVAKRIATYQASH